MIQFEIEDGVLLLRAAPEGFTFLRDALQAAATDPAAFRGMPILLDVRNAPTSHRYEDVRWRVQVLADMRESFGPRWAFWVGEGPALAGVRRMFRVFSEIGGLEVGLFADKATALSWLRERP